ncbi:MAG: S8 family peptidase [Candidatus Hodarchaeales archaeon]
MYSSSPSNSLHRKIVHKTFSSFEQNFIDEVPYGIPLIGADKVWSQTLGSPGIVVAVLDTGLDASHSDLEGCLWNNSDEIPDNGADDDNNGFIDDCHGWDFIHNDNDPSPWHNHGTHVVGTITARLNNYGVVGVAPNISIMPLLVVNESDRNPDIIVAEAIRYAADNGAHIISMSIGIYDDEITNSTSYDLVTDAITYAYSKGLLIVAAAGNEGTNHVIRPANDSRVIAVGAVNSGKNLASFSNYGLDIEVVAPGDNVKSTIPVNNFGLKSGTSMATPHVSGALALMLSYDPTLTNIEAREILNQTAEDLGDSGWDETYGYGLINVSRAIDVIANQNSNPTSTNPTSETAIQSTSTTSEPSSITSVPISSSVTTSVTSSSDMTTNTTSVTSKVITNSISVLFVIFFLSLCVIYKKQGGKKL